MTFSEFFLLVWKFWSLFVETPPGERFPSTPALVFEEAPGLTHHQGGLHQPQEPVEVQGGQGPPHGGPGAAGVGGPRAGRAREEPAVEEPDPRCAARVHAGGGARVGMLY